MAEDDGVERDPSKVNFVKNGEIKLFPDDPTSETKLKRFRTKGHSEFYDPCSEAAKMSMKCLERNNYDRKKCKDYFQAYRDCTAEWRRRV